VVAGDDVEVDDLPGSSGERVEVRGAGLLQVAGAGSGSPSDTVSPMAISKRSAGGARSRLNE
jgi:hypothetical protein